MKPGSAGRKLFDEGEDGPVQVDEGTLATSSPNPRLMTGRVAADADRQRPADVKAVRPAAAVAAPAMRRSWVEAVKGGSKVTDEGRGGRVNRRCSGARSPGLRPEADQEVVPAAVGSQWDSL